jgi:hypothetical protein
LSIAARIAASTFAAASSAKAATPTLIAPGHISIAARPHPHVSAATTNDAGAGEEQEPQNRRKQPELNKESFAWTIRRWRIEASGRFTNLRSRLVNEPVLRERNADRQEDIDPREETDCRVQLRLCRARRRYR